MRHDDDVVIRLSPLGRYVPAISHPDGDVPPGWDARLAALGMRYYREPRPEDCW